MARIFQIKRGLRANLPTLAQGEFAMTTDSGAEVLWLGTGSQNKKLPLDPTAADVGAVSKSGDTMTGDLLFGGGYGRVASTSSVFQLESRAKVGDTKNRRMLILRNSSAHELKTALSVMDVDAAGKQTTHLVYHSGNKPTASDVGALALDGSNRFSGDYTGNGSKTSRTVEAGASSELLAILSEIGMVLVGISGAICLDKRSGEVFGLDGVAFDHGMLSIWTDSEFVNGAQRSYWYQVL